MNEIFISQMCMQTDVCKVKSNKKIQMLPLLPRFSVPYVTSTCTDFVRFHIAVLIFAKCRRFLNLAPEIEKLLLMILNCSTIKCLLESEPINLQENDNRKR